LLVSQSGKVVSAVQKPLKGLGNFVFGEQASESSTPRAGSPQEDEEDSSVSAEIRRVERKERGEMLEMLMQMFPGKVFVWGGADVDLDKEVVEAVIVAKEGRIGVCIDICLEMSGGGEETSGADEGEGKDLSQSEDDLLGLEGENGVPGLRLEDSGDKRSETVDLMS
jgi:CUE domain